MFDLEKNKHFGLCHRRQHETFIDEAWPPTLLDFFCECGGVYYPTTNVIAIGDVEVLRDFVCPSCATRWRFQGAVMEHGGPSQHESLSLALGLAQEVNRSAVETRPDVLADMAAMRAVSEGPPVSGLRRFLGGLFSRFNEPIIPPDDMPEKQRYLAWARETREQFDALIQEEAKEGLHVWNKDDQG